MMALIDLDPLPYAYGGLTFEDGELLPDSILQRKVDEKIKNIMERSGSETFRGYLTDSASNFRIDVATILPYKGNRADNAKPPKWGMLRQYLLDTYPDQVKEVVGYEADDQLAIDQYNSITHVIGSTEVNGKAYDIKCDTIICTIDKDLQMVPGWHYNWQHDEKKFVTEVEGLRFFYKQLLTGDMTDNIKGLYGVGPKSKLVSEVMECDDEWAMAAHVYCAYWDRFGQYADQFMDENARLLWMKRTPDDKWEYHDVVNKHKFFKERELEDDIPF